MHSLSNNRARAGACKHNATTQGQRQQHRTPVTQKQQKQMICCQATTHNAAGTTAAMAAAAAAVVLQSCLVAAAVPPPAAAAAAAAGSSQEAQQQQQQWQQQQRQPVIGDLAWGAQTATDAPALAADEQQQEEDLQEIEDDIMAQVAIPQELTDFMQMMQQGATPKSSDKLSAARKAVGFDRTVDGRVLLISDDGEPFQVKPDMGVPGALLLRDAGGYMYYIPGPDAPDSLVQIDLSDDAIVAQLFANHAWEELLEPLEVVTPTPESASRSKQQQQPQDQQPQEHLEQLRLSERDFRSVLSLLRDSMQLPEEPLEDLDAQEMVGRTGQQ